MAVQLKNFGVRTLSAIVFGVLLIGCIYVGYLTFTVFFVVVTVVGLHELYRLAASAGVNAYRKTGLVCALALYASFIRWDFLTPFDWRPEPYLVMGLLPVIVLSRSLFDKSGDAVRNALVTLGGMFYVVLPFALLHKLVIIDMIRVYTPLLLLWIIVLIWTNDTFAYVWGSLLGKRKLFPRVSPGKTIEGTVLGTLTTFGVACLIHHYTENAGFWLVMGLAVPLAATTGDLAESQLKRAAGVKDSGNIMPGHGGVLDRFDSLMFVSPVAVAILACMKIWTPGT